MEAQRKRKWGNERDEKEGDREDKKRISMESGGARGKRKDKH